jgi:hypothetical protein
MAGEKKYHYGVVKAVLTKARTRTRGDATKWALPRPTAFQSRCGIDFGVLRRGDGGADLDCRSCLLEGAAKTSDQEGACGETNPKKSPERGTGRVRGQEGAVALDS